MDKFRRVQQAASGRWVEILDYFGVAVGAFRGKNTNNSPCPLCGGDDRAHWRMTDDRVSLFCRSCAAEKMKSAEEVLMEYGNYSFVEMIDEVARFLHVHPDEYELRVVELKAAPKVNVPKTHKQDFKMSNDFLENCEYTEEYACFVGGYKHPCRLPIVNGKPCLPVVNSDGVPVNIAAVTFPVQFLAGGITYGGYHEIPGDDYICYFTDIGEAIKWHLVCGCTVRCVFDIYNLIWMEARGFVEDSAFCMLSDEEYKIIRQ